jgi:exodeoxyribonuclease VII small subunit
VTTDDRPAPDELGFSGCLEELDAIVKGLESDAIDVDELADRVERATELVHWCRQRLSGTRLRVTEVLERLDVELAGDDDRHDAGE